MDFEALSAVVRKLAWCRQNLHGLPSTTQKTKANYTWSYGYIVLLKTQGQGKGRS